MGMFDYIKCEAPLPATPLPPVGEFQTKDTPDQFLTAYTITADGRLTWRPYRMEEVPKAERPFPNAGGLTGLCGSLRRVEGAPETIPLHGDIVFYTSGGTKDGWWEYRARFTEGILARIELVDFKSPSGDEESRHD